MSERKTVILVGDLQRRTAAQYLKEAPVGYVVTFAEPTRNTAINAALHALLGEIADKCEWAGRKWDIETWKRLMVAAWCRANAEQVVMLPAIDGAGVDIVFRRTSQMSQAEVRDLLAFVEAWCAERTEFSDATAATA